MPSWVDSEALRVRGSEGGRLLSTGYLFLAYPPVNRTIRIESPLPTQEIVLKHRKIEIRTRLRENKVVEMDSFGATLTFFDPLRRGHNALPVWLATGAYRALSVVTERGPVQVI